MHFPSFQNFRFGLDDTSILVFPSTCQSISPSFGLPATQGEKKKNKNTERGSVSGVKEPGGSQEELKLLLPLVNISQAPIHIFIHILSPVQCVQTLGD